MRETTPNSLEQLASDMSTLVRQELEFAKNELAEKARSAGVGAGMLSASAITGFITLACLSALLIIALSLLIPAWASALIVTAVWASVTAALVVLGKRKVQEAVPFVPEKTIENLKEDVAWAQSSAKRLET
jgi:tetrahydromethanopterin S-methyltransferase subunit C